ncbi:MAG TPA: phage portal protein [Deinococcales bacterium]|nr:phage portal protein [Deinococcales bacterium]
MRLPFARPRPPAAEARAAVPITFLPGWTPRGQPRALDTVDAQLQAHAGWVQACADLIAADVAANPWRLEDASGPIAEHPAARLLRQPNAQQRWSDLIYTTDLHLSLTGQACWRLHFTQGRLTAVTLVFPQWLRGPVLDAGGHVRGHRIAAPGRPEEEVPLSELAFTRWPHPADPHRAAGPTQGVAASHDLDQTAREFTAALLHNRARPDGLLATDQELSREQADAIRERWRDTHATPGGEIAVLGKGVQYLPLSGGLKDLDFQALAHVTRDAILAAFRVPASKLGILENASLANGREADQNYKESALRPRLNRYAEVVNARLLPHFHHPGLRFAFENPIDEDRSYELDRATRALQAGAITINEYRDLIGLPPTRSGNARLTPRNVRREE